MTDAYAPQAPLPAKIRSPAAASAPRSAGTNVLGQFSRGMEGDDAAPGHSDAFAAAQIAGPAFRPVPRLKTAEAFELDRFSGLERATHLLEERVDHFAAFALRKPELDEQEVLKLFLRERRARDCGRRRRAGQPFLPLFGSVDGCLSRGTARMGFHDSTPGSRLRPRTGRSLAEKGAIPMPRANPPRRLQRLRATRVETALPRKRWKSASRMAASPLL